MTKNKIQMNKIFTKGSKNGRYVKCCTLQSVTDYSSKKAIFSAQYQTLHSKAENTEERVIVLDEN